MDGKQSEVPEARKRFVFVASECENQQQADKALHHVQQYLQDSSEDPNPVCVVSSVAGLSNTMTLSEWMMRQFRRRGKDANERQMVLSTEEQMLSVQLCLAEIHKQKYGEFGVEASQVIEYNTKLIDEKLSPETIDKNDDEYNEFRKAYNEWLQHCNCRDLMDVYTLLRNEDFGEETVLILGSPVGKVEQNVAKILLEGGSVFCLHFGLDESEAVTMETAEEGWILGIGGNSQTPSRAVITEAHIESVLMSHLHLLVNSRSELALARVITGPQLDHAAFTDVRRAAKERNMPMYQTILSFVMRLRLGGRSYQAAVSCPLAQHTKPLAEFTDLMHKLTTVLEEEEDKKASPRHAAKRVVTVVKGALLKNRGGEVRKESITAVADKLHNILEHLQVDTLDPKDTTGGKSLVGRQTLRVLRQVVDVYAGQHSPLHSVHILSDCFASQSTPIRIPSLVSQFRSPLDQPTDPSSPKPLHSRLSVNNATSTPVAPKRYKSSMEWAMPVHDVGLNLSPMLPQDTENPSEVLIRPPTPEPEVTSAKDQPAVKRTLSNSLPAPAKKAKKAPSGRGRTGKKKDTLQKGQKQLTAFFRV